MRNKKNNNKETILLKKIKRKITIIFILLVALIIALQYGSLRLMGGAFKKFNSNVEDIKYYLMAKDDNFQKIVDEEKAKREEIRAALYRDKSNLKDGKF